MIRPVYREDRDDLLRIAIASGLFNESDIGPVAEMLDAYLDGDLEPTHEWTTYVQESTPVAVAYFAPEPFTIDVWNLYMLAVDPGNHGVGLGAELIRYVESRVRTQNARLMIIETSSLERFQRTRSFYKMCGYVEESRIRDYYSAGDDKITFWKRIAEAPAE